ncbi:MAG: cellulose synthase [Ramlibacter sp.]
MAAQSVPSAASPAEVFRRLAADRWISREITFAELGFAGPLVLGAPDSGRELYLPVPANVPLSGAELKLNANYMRADGGRTTLLVSLDTFPVSSRPFAQDRGDASLTLGVDGAPRPGGFVHLGLNWGTALGADWICADARTAGNVLRIEPDSRFSYRYDGAAIRDLTTAWGALPQAPVILVSATNLGTAAYDSAWRLGVALERAGRHPRIAALPAAGDMVNLDGVQIPAALRGSAALAGLAQGGMHKLKDAGEVGALLSLGATGPFRADIVITDKAMDAGLKGSFDAFRAQLLAAAPDAAEPYDRWRAQSLDPADRATAPGEVRVAWAFGRPAIVVADDAGAKAAGLFSTAWSRVAVAGSLVVKAAGDPATDVSAVSLRYLGGKPGSFDVLAHSDWNAAFDIGTVAANGRLPRTLVLDVAAAPGGGRTPPVASVFMNDVLLGARQLAANGKAERITATVPRYSLAAHNVIRVSFVRQLASDRCRETPEPYPVSVLDTSHMLLEKAEPSDDFNGMVARYARGAHVLVPAAYLADSAGTLPRVIGLATALGVSPLNARFTAVNGTVMPAAGGAFLAIGLPLPDAAAKVRIDGSRVVLAGDGDKPLLDLTGLNNVGIAEVVKVSGDTGVAYHGAAGGTPPMDKPILLGRGDVALIGASGLLAEINTADPDGRSLVTGEERPWLLSRGYWWMMPIAIFAFMIGLLVFASRRRRRKAGERAAP